MTTQPLVVAVARSGAHHFSKEAQPSIRLIAGEGVEHDAHRGRTTQHIYRMQQDPTQPNLCQVHLLGEELLDELASAHSTLLPGELGENIVTRGLDLLHLPLGTRLHLGASAIVEVTGLRTPCSQIDRFRPGLQQHLWTARSNSGRRQRKAGIMSTVFVAGILRAGDAIVVELPPRPHLPLPPV